MKVHPARFRIPPAVIVQLVLLVDWRRAVENRKQEKMTKAVIKKVEQQLWYGFRKSHPLAKELVQEFEKLERENAKLKNDLKKARKSDNFELTKAEQQLTGYDHHHKGGDITSLVEGMALRAEEWQQLKADMPWLSEKLVKQIDAHFEKK